jgi:flagellin-like protein
MMKFFRKHRKAVSPVIATMLLVAVAVAAVGAYFIWFRSFQTQSQGSVQEAASGALGSEVQVANIANDQTKYYITLKNAGKGTVSGIIIAVAGNPNEVATQTWTIPAGNSKTVEYNATAYNPITPGLTRVFTIEYTSTPLDGPPTTGTVVHTYTNS